MSPHYHAMKAQVEAFTVAMASWDDDEKRTRTRGSRPEPKGDWTDKPGVDITASPQREHGISRGTAIAPVSRLEG